MKIGIFIVLQYIRRAIRFATQAAPPWTIADRDWHYMRRIYFVPLGDLRTMKIGIFIVLQYKALVMKILCVTSFFPYPLDQGAKIRNYHLIKHLSKSHEVYLLSLCPVPVSDESVAEMSAFCSEIQLFENKRTFFRRVGDAIRSIVQGTPYIIEANSHSRLQSRSAEMQEKHGVDAVVFHEICMTGNMVVGQGPSSGSSRETRVLQVLDAHNVESQMFERIAESTSNPLQRMFFKRESKLLRETEQVVSGKLDLVCTVSDGDSKYFGQFANKVVCAPNGIESVVGSRATCPMDPPNVLFVGSLTYQANRDALHYYYYQVLPHVRRLFPDVHLTIISRSPAGLRYQKDPSVRVEQSVEELAPFYEKATISIAPLLAGGGTRLKILEAFSFGVPVVSTSIGAEGIGVSNGENILLGDSPEAFAKAMCRLFNEPRLAETIADNAKKLVEKGFLWSQVAQNIDRSLRKLRA